jgi:uncharacterized secreted protein with C-terminal beta-propeller domain
MEGSFPKDSRVEDMSEIYKRKNAVYGVSPSALIEEGFYYRYQNETTALSPSE